MPSHYCDIHHPACDYIKTLEAENERLREALGRIADGRTGASESPSSYHQVARDALRADSR